MRVSWKYAICSRSSTLRTGIRNAKSWKLELLAVGGHRDHPWSTGRSTLVQSGPQGDRVSVVEFLAVWRRDAGGGLRLVVDYYRH